MYGNFSTALQYGMEGILLLLDSYLMCFDNYRLLVQYHREDNDYSFAFFESCMFFGSGLQQGLLLTSFCSSSGISSISIEQQFLFLCTEQIPEF